MTSPTRASIASASLGHAPMSRAQVSDVQAAVARVMSNFGPDYWALVDEERRFPEEAFRAAGEAGWFGTFVPEGYGGAGAGPYAAAAIVEGINAAGGAAGAINAQMSIGRTLVLHGSEAQKERWLPGMARGDVRFLTVAAPEPDSGADMGALLSTARRDGDDWILDAKKVLISFSKHTRLMILLARADEGTTIFLLDLDEVGDRVERHPIDLVAHRMTTSLFIDGLRVPDSARIGPVGQGVKCLSDGFVVRRVLAASEALGNARFLLDRSLAHVRQRVTRGRPIGVHQGVQYPLVQAYMKVEAADLVRWDALDAEGRGEDAVARSAMAKVLASEAAWETTRAALTAFGGWGLAREYHVERKLREGTVYVFNNLLMSMVADRALDLPKL